MDITRRDDDNKSRNDSDASGEEKQPVDIIGVHSVYTDRTNQLIHAKIERNNRDRDYNQRCSNHDDAV